MITGTMMKNAIVVTFLLSLFASHCFAEDFTTMQTAASIGDDAVASGRGVITYHYERIDSLSQRALDEDKAFLSRIDEGRLGVIQNIVDIEYTYTFSGAKIVCHESSNTLSPSGTWYKRNWKWVFDGENMSLLRLDPIGKNGLILPLGSIRSGNHIPLEINDPRYDALLLRGASIGAFLTGEMDGESVDSIKTVSTEDVDGISCEVVQGNTGDTDEVITAWLAPSIMYRPKRVEIMSSREKIVINNDFKNHGNGIWFPHKITRETYTRFENTDKEALYSIETIQVHDDYALNVDIPSDTFEISFPAGMIVYDYRTGNTIEAK